MSKQGRPNSQFNTAKRETEEAEEFERFRSSFEHGSIEEIEEVFLGNDSFERLEEFEEEDY